MGEVVPTGGHPDRPNATIGQALFTAIVDELEAAGIPASRGLVATAVRHGKSLLEDGFQPEIVLAGCVTAIRRGKPQWTAYITQDIALAQAGAFLTTQDYNRLLLMENRRNNPAAISVREAVEAARSRKQLGGDHDS